MPKIRNMNARIFAVRPAAAVTLACFVLAACSGCKPEDRMDNAMMKGATSGVKAIGHKADGQKRVDDATAILDSK